MAHKLHTFKQFALEIISQMNAKGKSRVSETYASSLKSFMNFTGNGGIMLKEITQDKIFQYELYLKGRGVCANTSSFYMRNLRAIYNRAVENGFVSQSYPFKNVYTGVGKTIKRAISLDDMRKLKSLDLSYSSKMCFARDMFLFSFYTMGMSFVDIAYLKKSDVSYGILSYRRRKTGQQLFVKWESLMQDMVDKYMDAGSPYLFPIINDFNSDSRRQYIRQLHSVNRSLKDIGEILGLPLPLTMYTARHTWASIAYSKNIPVSIISQGMGHVSEQTTRIYLASINQNEIGKANRKLLKMV